MYPLLIAFRHGEFALYGIGHLVIQRDGLARSLHVDHTQCIVFDRQHGSLARRRVIGRVVAAPRKQQGGGQQKRPKRKKFDFFHMKV